MSIKLLEQPKITLRYRTNDQYKPRRPKTLPKIQHLQHSPQSKVIKSLSRKMQNSTRVGPPPIFEYALGCWHGRTDPIVWEKVWIVVSNGVRVESERDYGWSDLLFGDELGCWDYISWRSLPGKSIWSWNFSPPIQMPHQKTNSLRWADPILKADKVRIQVCGKQRPNHGAENGFPTFFKSSAFDGEKCAQVRRHRWWRNLFC